MEQLPPPIPAATLVLFRPAPPGPPELLMMERSAHMAFAAGALVFPGGRIDAADHEAASALAPGLADGSARIAAVRETIEESGIVPALTEPLPEREVEVLRDRLHAGHGLAAAVQAIGVGIDLAALIPFARWCPNFREARRFDTLFFLCPAPPGAPAPTAQAGEGERVFWARAADVLGEVEAGRARAIFPTRRNLERLARFNSFDEAAADARRHPVRKITPWVEERDGEPWLRIPDDAGYPVTAEPLASARRF